MRRARMANRRLANRWAGVVGVVLSLAAPAALAQPLPEALASAYTYSPDLRAARRQLDVVNERRPQALAAWLPSISMGGSLTRAQTNSREEAYRTQNGALTSTLTMPITRGGGEFAGLRSAEHAIRAQRALLLASEQVVLGQAAQAYMDVLLNEQLLRFRQENLAALKRMADLIARQVRVGDRTAVDAGLAEARVADADAALAQAEGALQVSRAAFVQYVGRPPERLAMPRPLSQLPPSLEEALKLAEAGNPDVVAARFQLAAARDDAEVALAALLPSLSIEVSDLRSRQRYAGYPAQTTGPITGTTVALVLSVPLYQGGAEYASVRAARKTTLQRREELAGARIRAIAAVTTAWRQRAAATAAQVGYTASLAANERLSQQYRVQAEAGELTVLEVLNGLQDLLNAQINKATADHDRVLADYALLNALGGLTARTLALAAPYHDPEGDYRRTRWRIWGLSVED